MKLFSLETRGLGIYYVVAPDWSAAESALRGSLEAANYGFTGDREVVNISFLATLFDKTFPTDKRLIIHYTNS